MEVKKGYKQTEVGVIPEDWGIITAADACTKIQDGTHFSPKLGGNDYLYITSKNIRFGFLDISSAERITELQHRMIYRRCDVKNGDLLLTKDGANTGNAALNSLDEEFSLLSSVAFLRFATQKYLAGYFLQQILSHQGQKHIQDAMTGNAITRLTLEKINKLCFPLPPTKAEQTAIATALSDADALIQSLEKLIAKKRLIKQGAMQELLKPKEGWVVKKLGEIFTFHGGYTASREQLSDDGYCYLHYGDIHGATKTFINVKSDYAKIPKLQIPLKKVSPKLLLNEGDIVFVDASEDDEGTSRHIVVQNPDGVPYISGLHTIVAKSKDDSVNNDYKRYCFQIAYIKSQFKFYAVGTKVSGISKTNILKIKISLPTLDEQIRIATILSDMDAELSALETKLAKCKQVKQGMMQELLTGKIRLV